MLGDFKVNGSHFKWEFEPHAILLDVLRSNGFTEVKEGCRSGECGACLVLLDGHSVNACRVLAASVMERPIITVQGLGSLHHPHSIQTALVEAGAVQCGFCTPGMVIAAYALLSKNPNPNEDEIRLGIDGNLCRCTGYVKIVQGIRLAAEKMKLARE